MNAALSATCETEDDHGSCHNAIDGDHTTYSGDNFMGVDTWITINFPTPVIIEKVYIYQHPIYCTSIIQLDYEGQKQIVS